MPLGRLQPRFSVSFGQRTLLAAMFTAPVAGNRRGKACHAA